MKRRPMGITDVVLLGSGGSEDEMTYVASTGMNGRPTLAATGSVVERPLTLDLSGLKSAHGQADNPGKV